MGFVIPTTEYREPFIPAAGRMVEYIREIRGISQAAIAREPVTVAESQS